MGGTLSPPSLGVALSGAGGNTSGAGGKATQERPNILWIVSEDNAAQWLGCYGNKEAQTPRIDALAKTSVLFERAYANAPVCAVSRCTILNGAYSPTLGTQNMRSRHAIPTETFKPYVSYLRQQGYYCTNNAKTDYNFKGNDTSYWDLSSNRAHYRNRPAGKPFFAVFNIEVSHESNLFPTKVKANREKGLIPETPRLNPKTLFLPPYVPDLPELRSDWAIYHDTITAMDKQVGTLLDELEKSGQAENTIVFYYADHGGPTPRGKRYLEDTGVHIPLLVHVPKKWQHLSPFAPGQRVRELVSFVDFAPTLLSLSGLKKPAQMQGRAFLGTERVAPKPNSTVFLYADRFDELYGMRRAVTDGRFRYIRRFMPHLPSAPYSYYQLEIPGWAAWQKAWQEGKLTGYHKALWEPATRTEELFDTQSDPWEIHNLAREPAQAGRLAAMRTQLKKTMAEVHDTALVPEPMYAELAGKGTIHGYVNSNAFPLPQVLDLAFLASAREAKNLPALIKALESPHPVVRYWGALGCVALGKQAKAAKEPLTLLLLKMEASPTVRITALHAISLLSTEPTAKEMIAEELDETSEEYVAQLAVNTLMQLNALNTIPMSWVERTLKDNSANEYLKRLATRLQKKQETMSIAKKPNVVLILADDMGWSDLGCYGSEIQTPNLDGLAKSGLRFTQFYNTARCWPSRAGLLTGYYAQQVRRDTVPGVKSGGGGTRPEWAPLLSTRLKALGYRSYHSGKWHVDGKPLQNGFERSYSLQDHDRYFAAKEHTLDDKPLAPMDPKSGYYSTTYIADHAIQCLKEHDAQHKDQPFFTYLAFTSPHFPVQALPEDIARYKDAYVRGWDALREVRYAKQKQLGIAASQLSAIEREVGPPYPFPEAIKKLGPNEVNRPVAWDSLSQEQKAFQATKMAIHAAMVDRMDKEIGRVLAQVKAMGAQENTIVLFLSDNGASAEMMVRGDGHDLSLPMGADGTFLSIGPGWSSLANTPLRRHKTWVHEGGISTPLIVSWPKGIVGNDALRTTPTHLVDIVPTILELAGETTPLGHQAPGKSLTPLFAKDNTVAHESLWWAHEGNRALRVGDWKIVAAGKDAPWELYNLKESRAETENLADKYPEKVKELGALWQAQWDAYVKQALESPLK